PALPRLPSGKVDRRALPRPDEARPAREFVAPRSPLEEKLAEIWRSVLRVSEVGVQDDFFALGGHSLLATQITSRIPRELVVDLPLHSHFERPTIAAQAVAVTQLRAAQVEEDELALLLEELERLPAVGEGVAAGETAAGGQP